MIVIVKESGDSYNYREFFLALDPECREYSLDAADSELLAGDPDVAVLFVPSVDLCRRLRSLGKRHMRILMVLESEKAESSIAARIAGADSCIIAPFSRENLLHAVGNEHAAAKRWLKIENLANKQTLINERYKIKRVLGMGIRSSILLVHDTVAEKDVSIKLLRKMLLEQHDAVREFLEEAEKLCRFHSPYMVEVLDVGRWEGAPFLVMNIGEAENLYTVMRNKKFQEVEIETFALNMVHALTALKHFKMLHLDIKPENILYENGRFLLSEFGILSRVEAPRDNSCFPYWGASAFASPEFFQADASLTARSDIYSLGVLLYMIALRKNPFYGYYYSDVYKRHVRRENFPCHKALTGFCSPFNTTLKAMTQLSSQARPRLRELEVIFCQSIAIHTGHLEAAKTTGALFTEKKQNVSNEKRLDELEVEKTNSGVVRVRNANSDEQIKNIFDFLFKRFCSHWQVCSVVLFLFFLLFFLGFFFGNSKRPPVYFSQGNKIIFTCYNGHSHALRTLDFRTVHCPECKELTSPSRTCRSCGKIFGLSLWPLRDMTEKECEEFEDKCSKCPFCRSKNIVPTKIDSKEQKKK